MRIGHTADLHLGYRSGNRCTPEGMNVRESDVAQAFRCAVDGMLAAKVDLVVIAGDVFHRPSPSPAAITFAYRELKRLREAGTPVVMIAGNHESPRTAETGSILRLFAEIGVDVAVDAGTTFRYSALECRVVAVPFPALTTEIPTPAGPDRHNVLVIHGPAEGVCPTTGPAIPAELLQSEEWSTICCGDWHRFKQVGPKAYYSGSLEFCSSDIWSESGTPKSWNEVDLESGVVTPHAVPTRRVLDLDPVDATDLEPARVNEAIAGRIRESEIEGAIVRLKVLGLARAVQRELCHRELRKLMMPAFNFQLDVRRPEVLEVGSRVERAALRRLPLSEIVASYLAGRELPAGIDRAAFTKLGSELLEELEPAG
jgi:exonuclease SbcD